MNSRWSCVGELGVLEHDLRHERPCLEISPALELEEIALRADDGPLGESFEQSGFMRRPP